MVATTTKLYTTSPFSLNVNSKGQIEKITYEKVQQWKIDDLFFIFTVRKKKKKKTAMCFVAEVQRPVSSLNKKLKHSLN